VLFIGTRKKNSNNNKKDSLSEEFFPFVKDTVDVGDFISIIQFCHHFFLKQIEQRVL